MAVERPQLLVGVDRRGQLAWLGEDDSAGLPVGYIDSQRQCWINIAERDLTVSARAVHYYFEIGSGSRQALNLSAAERIVSSQCQRPRNRRLALLSSLAAIAYSRRLDQQLDDHLAACFLTQALLGRAWFSSPQELNSAWRQWLKHHRR